MELLVALEQEFGESWAQNIIHADEPATSHLRSRQVVSWHQVKTFVDMAEEALKAKSAANDRIRSQLEIATAKIAQANEEQEFLKEQIESLISDRTTQQQKLQELVRQNYSLEAEVNILRAHLVGQECVDSPCATGAEFAVMKIDFQQPETFGVVPLLTLKREPKRISPGATQPDLHDLQMESQNAEYEGSSSPSSHDQWGKHSLIRSAQNTLTGEHFDETESTEIVHGRWQSQSKP